MFSIFGKIIARGWPLFLACWIVLLAAVHWTAPSWNEIADDHEFGFLPEDSPSRQGEALFHKAFPNELLASNVVLVVHREDQKLLGADYTFIDKVLKPGLVQIAEKEGGFADPSPNKPSSPTSKQSIITDIMTAKDVGTGPLLVSADRHATLVVMDFTTEFMERQNWSTVRKIEDLLGKLRNEKQVPAGLEIHLTGSATVGRDVSLGQARSASSITLWTVIMVIGLLMLIYRAPVLALVPLVTLFVAIQVSLGLLSLLAEAGVFTVFEGVQIYITIILYGAGVDYCLFLMARYREELESGQEMAPALAGAIAKVGASLTASAATVMFGIGMMTFADFGKFHYAGGAIFFSLFVGLAAVLTLAAPLLRLAGRWAFWPKRPPTRLDAAQAEARRQDGQSGWFSWKQLATWLVGRPGTIWLTSVALMTPFAVMAVFNSNWVNYDFLRVLPADASGVVGTKALQAHFSTGISGPITVLISSPRIDFRTDENQAMIKTLANRLKGLQDVLGLTDIRSLADPLGITKAGKLRAPSDLALPIPPQAIPLGTGGSIFEPGWSSSLGGALDLGEKYQQQKIVRQRALEHYVSSTGDLQGHVTRLQLLLDKNPLSREGAEQLDLVERKIREELPRDLKTDSEVYFIGPAASIRDLIAVTGSDEVRIKVLVTCCVLLILMVLLRKPVISVYLVASVLFSFFTTLGVTFASFWLMDPEGFPGLDWKVSILLFTVLVAIGEDYNIFLMTRVDEEQRRADPIEGITRALVKTGGIITSCGLIMAGTFASLLAASLVDLQQLGFALAFGVLLDTFVVRPVLVPAFLILLQRRRHWI